MSKADEIDHLVDGDSVGDAIGLCGCGSPSLAIELVAKLLAYYRDLALKANAGENVAYLESLLGPQDGGVFWFVLYQLDTLELTEHGSGIRFGWLTPRGKAVLAFIEKHGTDEDNWPNRWKGGVPW